MITQKVRKVGNSYVVTIPKDELERRHIVDGDLVGVEIRKMHVSIRPDLSAEVSRAAERSLERYDADLRYLADR